ncbi:hypothetical protein ACWCRF_22490 [Streptomyces sp. NPDC002405]
MTPGALCASRIVSTATREPPRTGGGSRASVVTLSEERLYPANLVR